VKLWGCPSTQFLTYFGSRGHLHEFGTFNICGVLDLWISNTIERGRVKLFCRCYVKIIWYNTTESRYRMWSSNTIIEHNIYTHIHTHTYTHIYIWYSSWQKHCATNRKVSFSIPDEANESSFSHALWPSERQSLTEMEPGFFLGVKSSWRVRLTSANRETISRISVMFDISKSRRPPRPVIRIARHPSIHKSWH
jgi:hypothetical protein